MSIGQLSRDLTWKKGASILNIGTCTVIVVCIPKRRFSYIIYIFNEWHSVLYDFVILY